MAPIIEANGLSKRYRIEHGGGGGYQTLRESLSGLFRRRNAPAGEDFWALKDVSFQVQAGERVGIIGRNGAGKSTLLKLLSRITAPSSGSAVLRGRVASLLEVGTGFHRELTGRENIYLNGAILGMSRAEVASKFDEIVAFAEVERFLDTPVKRYSSGMYMRLAFAVAAHLDPEILVVDEVLAVGDASFQRKCLQKMEDVNASGRTILFVSHQLNAIQRLCNRCLVLEAGALALDTRDVDSAIKRYLHGQDGSLHSRWASDAPGRATFTPRVLTVSLADGAPLRGPVAVSASVQVSIEADVMELDPSLTMGFALFDDEGNQLFWSYFTDGPEAQWPAIKKGRITLRCALPASLLNEGVYRVELIGGLHHREWFYEPGKSSVSVNFELRGGLSESPLWIERRPGVLAPTLKWEAM